VAKTRHEVLYVPADLAIAFTVEKGWHYLPVPAAWWFEQQADLLEADLRALVAAQRLSARSEPVARASVPVTSCRPGSGPCGRRHEHQGAGRTAPAGGV
jgi:hypothetical protein